MTRLGISQKKQLLYRGGVGVFNFTTFWENSVDDNSMILFLFFPIKQDLTFHANCLHWRQFAWNANSCFLEKKKNISKCCDKFMIFFLFFPLNRIWHFMQIVSTGDLHEMSNPVSWEKNKKNKKTISKCRLLKLLSRLLNVKLVLLKRIIALNSEPAQNYHYVSRRIESSA